MLLALTLVVAGLGAHGARLGLSSHGDSRAIVERSIPAILEGTYVPGRSLGNPLYESICALLYRATGSLTALNYYSVVLAIVALLTFYALLAPSLTPARKALALLGFALNPLILINSSALIEWMQMTLLLLLQLGTAKAWIERRSASALASYAVVSALLVLTRPDAVWLCAALLLALLWESGWESGTIARLCVVNAVVGGVTAMIFIAINHGVGFVYGNAGITDTPVRRLGVAVMGLLNTFGPMGVVVLTVLGLHISRRVRLSERSEVTFWGRLFLAALPIFLLRFALLPDKLEYLLPLVVITLLALAHERLAVPWIVVATISLTMTSVVCISLFERSIGSDHLTIAIHLNRGAVAQDWDITRHDRLMTDPGFLNQLSNLIYADQAEPRPRLEAANFGIGITSEMHDLIIGEEQLYLLDNPRFFWPRYKRAAYRDIYVCAGSLMGLKPAWRLWQRPPTLPQLDPRTGQLYLHCRQEDP